MLAQDIDLDLDDPNSTNQPWWVSFQEAVRVGLAAELDLGTAQPTDIDALYVVGIGGGDPGPLLNSQANAGRLGIVAPGSATSSVNGAEAVSLGDTDAWRRLVPVGTTAQAGTVAVSEALVGAPVVRGVIGGENDHRPVNKALVGALWPGLWGHSLANLWGYASQADELGLWAAANLVPEGPLPSMRIENQPYGLLPATSLHRWKAATGDPAIEARLVPLVSSLVDTWAAAAERQAGQQADALRSLVRNPTAARYTWRWMVPTTLAHALAFRFNEPVAAADLNAWWTRQAAETPRLDPEAKAARQLVSVGWGHDVELRLVQPNDLPAGTSTGKGLSRLAGATVPELLAAGPVEGRARTRPPWGTSVLTELARHSLLATAAAAARRAAGQARVIVEPVSVDQRTATETETWATRMRPVDLTRRAEPAVGVRRNVVDGLKALATADVEDIDRSLRAALETATQRLDPWATAIAWRRLQDLAAAPRTLGVYGWVDAPRPRVTASDNRFVLAPSADQAAVTAVLRDRALHDPDADRWRMRLTSDPIRGALRLADLTREGAHPAESLGQMVEAIVQRPAVIDRLRAAFPTVQVFARADLKPRRVCNGAAVLDAAVNRPNDLRQLGVPAAQVTALQELAASVDALADLHVAEAVFGVVKGRTANVAAATTAAAGQAPPPGFDVVGTPRAGRVVNTVAVVVLPDAKAPTGAQPSPAAVADPAVAAYLDARSGDAAGAAWTWTTLDEAGARHGTVTLAAVELRPCDTVGLGSANLRDVVRDVSGAAGLGPDDPPGHATVRALAAALAGLPALSDDVGEQPEAGAVAAELATRYKAVRAAAVAAAAAARQATTPAAQRAALGRLARWGITPLAADTADAAIGAPGDRVLRAVEALERRVDESAPTLDDAAVPVLASSISALVAPEGPWPVFARLPAAAFEGVRAEPTAPGHGAAARSGLARDGRAGSPRPRSPGGGPARPAPRVGRPAAAGLVEPPWRPVADGRPAAVGHRGRAAVAPRRCVRPRRGAAGQAGREHSRNGGRSGGRPLRGDRPRRGAGQLGRVLPRPAAGPRAAGRRARGAARGRRGADHRRAGRHRRRGAPARSDTDGGRRAAGRGRRLPPSRSAACERTGRRGAGGPLMPYRFDLHVRLEAVHTANDPRALREALRAEVHDPVWLLGRQWQLGEHRGTDAASPALVHLTVTETPVTGRSSAPEDDPRITPPEAIIESEPEQWWTIGRRVRVGRALRTAVPAAQRNDPALLLAGLPAPYDALNGRVLDGLALYRARASLGLTAAQFAAQGVPAAEPADDWQPAELAYSATFSAGPTTLTIPRHDGGDVDWYSATADNATSPPSLPKVVRTSYPTRVSYDGAPHPRWWQIEEQRYDPGAVAPHRIRLASLMLIHLTASHGDDWFTAPLLSPTGTLVAVTELQVEDVMGLTVKDLPADDWSLYQISGRRPNELLVWPTVANPLTGTSALDDVQLGVDEDANVLWEIERRVDGIELEEPDEPGEEPPAVPPTGDVVVTGTRRYRYVPATTVPHLWHPYLSSDAGNVRRFVQGRLADLNVRPIAPRPGPTSRLLRDPAAGPGDPVHQIAPGAVPRSGIRIDRRHVLGRRVDGQPLLWVQRRRTALFAPPASQLRFDVLEEIPEIRS